MASAPVQIKKDGSITHEVCAFGQTLPTSAVASEHETLVLAAMLVKQPIHGVSACQAVCNLMKKCTADRLNCRSIWPDSWLLRKSKVTAPKNNRQHDGRHHSTADELAGSLAT